MQNTFLNQNLSPTSSGGLSENILSNHWSTYKYNLPNNILSHISIDLALNKFNEDILSKMNENQYLLVLFKIRTEDNLFRTISSLQKITKKEDKELLLESFYEYWDLKYENYVQIPISDICFYYKFVNLDVENSKIKTPKSKINTPQRDKIKTNLLKFGSFNFPKTMDLFEQGNVDFLRLRRNNDKDAIVYKTHSNAQYRISFYEHSFFVDYTLNNKSLVTFTDELLDTDNLGTFKRTIKNQVIYFLRRLRRNGEVDYKIKEYKYITTLSPKGYFINKIITMDLETRNENGKLIPYAISYFDGDKARSFYVSDYNNSGEMMKACILSLMIRKYHSSSKIKYIFIILVTLMQYSYLIFYWS